MYSSSSVMTMSTGPDGQPQVALNICLLSTFTILLTFNLFGLF